VCLYLYYIVVNEYLTEESIGEYGLIARDKLRKIINVNKSLDELELKAAYFATCFISDFKDVMEEVKSEQKQECELAFASEF